MSTQRKSPESEWRHPVPVSLLQGYGYKKDIAEIIEHESGNFLSQALNLEASKITNYPIPIPIESIASSLNIEVTTSRHPSSFLATTKQFGAEYKINQSSQNYYRNRFTLAHEIGHIVLRQLAGPLNYKELSQTRDTNQEEEVLCDLFASSILLPRVAVMPYLNRANSITTKTVMDIAKDFKVSRNVVLRRIAEINNHILLFWDEVKNPKKSESLIAERVTQVYKPVSRASGCYIPLYCTPTDVRFEPNLILECYEKGVSVTGKTKVSNLGSLPSGLYNIHCIFFQLWSNELIKQGLVEKRQRFYNMATLIEIKDRI